MQIGTLIQAAKAPFFSLEFFPPSDEAHLPGFYATVEQLRALDPLFVSVTYAPGARGSTAPWPSRPSWLGAVSPPWPI